jgi:hypothetical protein
MAKGAILLIERSSTCRRGFVWQCSEAEKDTGGSGSLLQSAGFGASVRWLHFLGYRYDAKESEGSGHCYTKQLAAHGKPFGHSRETSTLATAITP